MIHDHTMVVVSTLDIERSTAAIEDIWPELSLLGIRCGWHDKMLDR